MPITIEHPFSKPSLSVRKYENNNSWNVTHSDGTPLVGHLGQVPYGNGQAGTYSFAVCVAEVTAPSSLGVTSPFSDTVSIELEENEMVQLILTDLDDNVSANFIHLAFAKNGGNLTYYGHNMNYVGFTYYDLNNKAGGNSHNAWYYRKVDLYQPKDTNGNLIPNSLRIVLEKLSQQSYLGYYIATSLPFRVETNLGQTAIPYGLNPMLGNGIINIESLTSSQTITNEDIYNAMVNDDTMSAYADYLPSTNNNIFTTYTLNYYSMGSLGELLIDDGIISCFNSTNGRNATFGTTSVNVFYNNSIIHCQQASNYGNGCYGGLAEYNNSFINYLKINGGGQNSTEPMMTLDKSLLKNTYYVMQGSTVPWSTKGGLLIYDGYYEVPANQQSCNYKTNISTGYVFCYNSSGKIIKQHSFYLSNETYDIQSHNYNNNYTFTFKDCNFYDTQGNNKIYTENGTLHLPKIRNYWSVAYSDGINRHIYFISSLTANILYNNEPLDGAIIKLYRQLQNESWQVINQSSSNIDGKYQYDIAWYDYTTLINSRDFHRNNANLQYSSYQLNITQTAEDVTELNTLNNTLNIGDFVYVKSNKGVYELNSSRIWILQTTVYKYQVEDINNVYAFLNLTDDWVGMQATNNHKVYFDGSNLVKQVQKIYDGAQHTVPLSTADANYYPPYVFDLDNPNTNDLTLYKKYKIVIEKQDFTSYQYIFQPYQKLNINISLSPISKGTVRVIRNRLNKYQQQT